MMTNMNNILKKIQKYFIPLEFPKIVFFEDVDFPLSVLWRSIYNELQKIKNSINLGEIIVDLYEEYDMSCSDEIFNDEVDTDFFYIAVNSLDNTEKLNLLKRMLQTQEVPFPDIEPNVFANEYLGIGIEDILNDLYREIIETTFQMKFVDHDLLDETIALNLNLIPFLYKEEWALAPMIRIPANERLFRFFTYLTRKECDC